MKRITAWAAVLTLTLSLLTGCAQAVIRFIGPPSEK